MGLPQCARRLMLLVLVVGVSPCTGCMRHAIGGGDTRGIGTRIMRARPLLRNSGAWSGTRPRVWCAARPLLRNCGAWSSGSSRQPVPRGGRGATALVIARGPREGGGVLLAGGDTVRLQECVVGEGKKVSGHTRGSGNCMSDDSERRKLMSESKSS